MFLLLILLVVAVVLVRRVRRLKDTIRRSSGKGSFTLYSKHRRDFNILLYTTLQKCWLPISTAAA